MSMLNLTRAKLRDYRHGGDGLMLWATENVNTFDRSTRSWRPIEFWGKQVEWLKEALTLKNDRFDEEEFKHRFIVFCHPRGDAKSFLVVLICIWRFCVFPRERIILGANTKEQVTFVHYDVIVEHILNSPILTEYVGENNVMKQGTVLRRDKRGKVKDIASKDVISLIAPISTAQAIRSNITACSFSEMWKMKDETFYTELSGSIRAVKNGMALIDSVVAPKGHILYRLYKTSLNPPGHPEHDPLLYFSYYSDEHYNPTMTQEELASYRRQFLPSEYNRHFRNRWADAAYGMFTRNQISCMDIVGVPGANISTGEETYNYVVQNEGADT